MLGKKKKKINSNKFATNKEEKINSIKKIHRKKFKNPINKSTTIDLIWKKNPTATFIQLLRTKTIKNKIKNKYSEKNTQKKEIVFYLNVVASETKKRKKNS